MQQRLWKWLVGTLIIMRGTQSTVPIRKYWIFRYQTTACQHRLGEKIRNSWQSSAHFLFVSRLNYDLKWCLRAIIIWGNRIVCFDYWCRENCMIINVVDKIWDDKRANLLNCKLHFRNQGSVYTWIINIFTQRITYLSSMTK